MNQSKAPDAPKAQEETDGQVPMWLQILLGLIAFGLGGWFAWVML